MPARGERHDEAARARISEATRAALAKRRARLRVRARDVELLRSGRLPVSPAIVPYLEAAEDELAGLLAALGGPEVATPQQRVIVEDAARLGVAFRSELARYAETRDPECASRLSSLATARRSAMVAVGLNRLEKPVSIRDYLEHKARENGVHDPSGRAAEEEEAR